MNRPKKLSPLQRMDARRPTDGLKTVGRLPALVGILLVLLLVASLLVFVAGPAAALPIAAVPAQVVTVTPTPDCACASSGTFCPAREGYESCYTCSDWVSGQVTKIPADCNLSGEETRLKSCSATENLVTVKDYTWTCAYRQLNTTGCCKYINGTCSNGVTSKTCRSDTLFKGWSAGPCPPPPDCIPEPATILLAVGGFAVAGRYLRRRRAAR